MFVVSLIIHSISKPLFACSIETKKRKLLFVVESSINSAIFQILGWMSLFIPAESVPGRVGMGMTTLLTLTAMFSAVIINPRKMFVE